MDVPDLENFISQFSSSLSEGTFVKASVGNYKGADPHLQKVRLRPIHTKRGPLIQFNSTYTTRDEARNLNYLEAPGELVRLLSEGFRSAVIFTTEKDLHLAISKKGRAMVSESKPTFSEAPGGEHDRPKASVVDPARPYLASLGITTSEGRVRDKQQAKFRQIRRFVEIVKGLMDEAGLSTQDKLRIVDMGSGKGYLTFALYDHLAESPGIDAEVTGIEIRRELVDLCNSIARDCGYSGLRFESGAIGATEIGRPEVLIALHACDTATDDALFEGLAAGSRLLIAAPCCQKELRPQVRFPAEADRLNEFGLLLETETESVTDGIRALLLEDCGYSVKMIEFVSPVHTPKNTLITAVRMADGPPRLAVSAGTETVMKFYGVSSQKLHSLLKASAISPPQTEPSK